MPTLTAVLCRVSGYRVGAFFPDLWYAVFDGLGNVYKGEPGDTAAAVQIRYCDRFGVPEFWDAIPRAISPDEFDGTAATAELLYVIARQRAREEAAARRAAKHKGRGAVIVANRKRT